MAANQSYKPKGKVVDLVWENALSKDWALTYDVMFPAYDDPYVVNYLAKKAEKYNMDNPENQLQYDSAEL